MWTLFYKGLKNFTSLATVSFSRRRLFSVFINNLSQRLNNQVVSKSSVIFLSVRIKMPTDLLIHWEACLERGTWISHLEDNETGCSLHVLFNYTSAASGVCQLWVRRMLGTAFMTCAKQHFDINVRGWGKWRRWSVWTKFRNLFSPAAHRNLSKTHDGTPQNMALQKGGTKM
jgi:hypothetical protein